MAATSFHARSNSLPSDRQHPLVSELDDQVCRLRQSEATTSSSSIYHKLNSLQDLYDCVDQLLQLPLTQQTIVQKSFSELLDELLDGSLRMLDMCNTAKDALSQMKESVAELQSAIRRRQSDLVAETKRYLNSRKTVKKAIQKALKGMETNKSTSSNNMKSTSSNSVEAISMLREAESIVVEVLESLMSFITQSTSKSSSWSLVSKLIASKKNEVSANTNEFAEKNEVSASTNEFAEVDACLKTSKSSEEIQAHLKNLQPCIQDLEEGVESLFRCLIKTRASILNVHNL
ncbi:hypothetical protein LINPERHAP1_LOCUS11719 [Linum perenne]